MSTEQFENTAARIRVWAMETFPLAKQYNVGLHDSLLTSGIIDSLGALEVVMYIENEFGVEVLDEEMLADHFESIYSITQFVETKIGVDGGNSNSMST